MSSVSGQLDGTAQCCKGGPHGRGDRAACAGSVDRAPRHGECSEVIESANTTVLLHVTVPCTSVTMLAAMYQCPVEVSLYNSNLYNYVAI